ncbi:alpha-L-fucosidase [Chitinophaga nivalis]|uniref:alpha-L-fucosidase n=1 Tax=Chitinophaga nivalis TaxID=2991709 RepID=A0ABT3IEE7_9BACT|nr:alpha-L-fucosidase [Chitinophaga nivalis]MCW3467979.1 alpha-L-fucosidase [Chitinophaga nivalis]MCW3482330.1 alpha-L-fucosidase [Chitinophaga nivalis]
MVRKIPLLLFVLCSCMAMAVQSQDMPDMWTRNSSNHTHPGLKWFSEAKFGLFIHWGLYAQLAGKWNDSSYYGSGEWIMQRAKAPAAAYAQVASSFNPVKFDAEAWVKTAKASGFKYIVITAKHHEGFSMYDSKVTEFDIMDATPYKKDPMKALSVACRQQGIPFGFYYSQFLDWHEPNGGGNNWDFDPQQKDYLAYYRSKSIPQLKELLTNYGPLGLVWFDMPGGLTKAQTQQLTDTLRRLQPGCLFSSRIGHELGDYRDFGDSEVPPVPIPGAWESIYTHNDSWGYIRHDLNFKSPASLIRLLSNVASKGGNLLLNVGPDGDGAWPAASIQYLQAVGKWLLVYGESIYGTTWGLIPAQPWGVTTSKPGKLFLHVWQAPDSRRLRVPGLTAKIRSVKIAGNNTPLTWQQLPEETIIRLPVTLPDTRNTVLIVEYKGIQPDLSQLRTQTISSDYPSAEIPAVWAIFNGRATPKLFTYSHYFGDWKHENCATGLRQPEDALVFPLEVQNAGDYRVILDYACEPDSAGQQGVVTVGGQQLPFLSLATGKYNSHAPMQFIQHAVGIIHLDQTGKHNLTVKPVAGNNKELCRLRKIILQPVK